MNSDINTGPKVPLDDSILRRDVEDESTPQTPDEDDFREDQSIDRAIDRETLKSLESDRKLRERQAGKVFRFAVWYCVIAALFLFMSGFDQIGFNLSDTVLAVIAGSTAVAAISQIGFVTQGLFKTQKREADPKIRTGAP